MSHDETIFDFAKVKQQRIKVNIIQHINPIKKADIIGCFYFVLLIFMLFLLLVCYSCRFLLLPLQW